MEKLTTLILDYQILCNESLDLLKLLKDAELDDDIEFSDREHHLLVIVENMSRIGKEIARLYLTEQ